MRTRHHMAMHLAGCLEHFRRRRMTGLFTDDTGRPLSDSEAREYIRQCMLKGWNYVPLCPSSECPDFDYITGECLGHPLPDEEEE